MEVVNNIENKMDTNFDIALILDFDTKKMLQNYQKTSIYFEFQTFAKNMEIVNVRLTQ